MPTKPSTTPNWDSNDINLSLPTTSHQNNGFQTNEIPSSSEFNGLFNLLCAWINYLAAGAAPGTFQARLSASSTLAVPTSDQTAVSTLYLQPFKGGLVSLYDGVSAWYGMELASAISLTVPSTTATMYDVFVYNNAGTLTLEAVAWTNDTTRATALAQVNGVYVMSGTGNSVYRYVGSFRTTGTSGQTEDSVAKRWVWNYYNRVTKSMAFYPNSNWAYSSNAWRQANANAAAQLDFVVGVEEDVITSNLTLLGAGSVANDGFEVGLGLNSLSTPNALIEVYATTADVTKFWASLNLNYNFQAPPGRNYLAWLENAGGATEAFEAYQQQGLTGTILG